MAVHTGFLSLTIMIIFVFATKLLLLLFRIVCYYYRVAIMLKEGEKNRLKEPYNKTVVINEIKKQFSIYTKLDNSFDWENLEIYIAENLVDAWLEARPYDLEKFNDSEFKELVSSASGKWLEKTCPTDKYKILLKASDQIIELVSCFAHETRHCLDYQTAVKNLKFNEYRPGDIYYNDWSEFRAVMAGLRCKFFLNFSLKKNSSEQRKDLYMQYGLWSADCVDALINSELLKDGHDILYYLSRFSGASRALRNIAYENGIHSFSLQLWQLMPAHISEDYGHALFYLANLWEDTNECALLNNNIPREFNELLQRVNNKLRE